MDVLELIISFGILLALALVAFCVVKWWNLRVIGVTPVPLFTFVSILFTSGLDVGLIMFPLSEFPMYTNPENAETYAFTNPLALEFGFWGFMIWAFYFLTSFYFCVIEPRVQFFEIPAVRVINNVVIIGTCAFTASLFLVYLPFYVPEVGDGETVLPSFYVVVFLTILAAAYSSTDIKFVRVLSVGSMVAFLALIALLWIVAGIGPGEFANTIGLIGGYFRNLDEFVIPMSDHHEFYLAWWFAWSIMIGQFTSRFVGGLRTQEVLLALLVVPSIPLAVWFSVLYYYHTNDIPTRGLLNFTMVAVGVTFVINSLDSLIRLYTDNLNLTVRRFGKWPYIAGNVAVLSVLTLLFQNQWLRIEWVGALVVGLYVACLAYILAKKREEVASIQASPPENDLDFSKIETAH